MFQQFKDTVTSPKAQALVKGLAIRITITVVVGLVANAIIRQIESGYLEATSENEGIAVEPPVTG